MKSIKYFLLTGLISLMSLVACQKQISVYNIRDFGARGDGKFMNTNAINAAIEKCSNNGGGRVLVPAGKYISGTIVLMSNVELHLDPGAVIKGSNDTTDYKFMKNVLFNEGYTHFGLIFSAFTRNISITGKGTMDGNGMYFMNGIDKPHIIGDYDRKLTRQGEDFMKPGTQFEDGPVSYDYRPGMLMFLLSCENVQLEDVFLTNSPEWTVRIEDCDNVEVRGITIDNDPLIPNNDGIHCTTSRNIRISDCNVSAGDDAIIVTGFGDLPLPGQFSDSALHNGLPGNKTGYAENVSVTNCVLSSRSACVRVGYGNHPVRNLVFSNLVMYNSNRGIGVFSRDNSSIEHVMFDNIIIHTRLVAGDWWGKGEPIHISAIQDTENGNPGHIDDITISNVTATGEAGIVIFGDKNSLIKNVRMNNIRLSLHGGKYSKSFGGNFDLRPSWPQPYRVFKHDIPGLYAENVKNLKISGFEMNWNEPVESYFTNAITADHFAGLTIEGFSGGPSGISNNMPAILLTNGSDAELINCKTSSGVLLVSKQNVK